MEEESDGDKTKYRCILHPLKSIIKDDKLAIIKNAVIDINKLVRNIYDFIHLHYTRLYAVDKIHTFKLSQNNIDIIADRLCKGSNSNVRSSYAPAINNTYKVFCEVKKYKPLEKTRYKRIIMDVCKDISVTINNNIKLHYRKRLTNVIFNMLYCHNRRAVVEKYIEVCQQTTVPIDYDYISKIKKNIASETNEIVQDVIDVGDIIFKYKLKEYKKAHSKDADLKELVKVYIANHTDHKKKCADIYKRYDLLVEDLRSKLLPKYTSSHFYLDIKKNPEHYIMHMIYMNNWLKEHNLKQFNCFPHRNINELKYIPISTCGIETLFKLKNGAKKHSIETGNWTSPTSDPHFYWAQVLDLDKKVFKNMIKRDILLNSIRTDGIGASLCFNYGECKEEKKEPQYIDDYTSKELKKMIGKKDIVYIDPGVNNLLMCMSDKTGETFRYTSKQQRFELKTHLTDKSTKQEKIDINKSNEDILKKFEEMDHKTCKYEEYKSYLVCCVEYEACIASKYYEKEKIRMNLLTRKINKKKVMGCLMRNIKTRFGDPLIVYGDWSSKENLKNNKPTIKIGMRREIKKNFRTLLLNEYNTSKIYHKTQEVAGNLTRIMKNKEGVLVKTKIHQILEATIPNKEFGGSAIKEFINRDKNAVENYKIIMHARLEGRKRPDAYVSNKPLQIII